MERHELGITYKDEGTDEARIKGLELASPKLPQIVKEILQKAKGKVPVVYCWRGGMRSESVVTILRMLKIQVFQLQSGYKGYRRFIFKQLKNYSLNQGLVVLHGLTGVGKTKILINLKEKGYPVIDLEGLAMHRGSVFGSLGMDNPHSQKDFEGLLWRELERYKDAPYILIEGEGRKIGPIFVPDFISNKIEEGCHILLEAPLETRVKRIIDEYIIDTDLVEKGKESLSHLQRTFGKEKVNKLQMMLEENDIWNLVKELCESYYDKHYDDSRKGKRYYAKIINAEKLEDAVLNLKKFLYNEFN